MAIKKVFKSYIPSNTYITTQGDVCVFKEGKCVTDNSRHIAELEWEIKRGNPHFYIDPDESEIDTTLQDRIAEAQKKATLQALEEYNKEVAAASGKDVDALQQEQAKKDESKATITSESLAALGNQQVGMSAASLLNVTNSAAVVAAAKK